MNPKGIGIDRWLVLVLIVLAMGIVAAAAADKVPRITTEDLKAKLEDPDLIIIDVRARSDWDESAEKVKGAIREDPNKPTRTWAAKYPKEKTIVLYCA